MKHIVKAAPVMLLLASYMQANAQSATDTARQRMMDSMMVARIDDAALLYPRIRQFSITHQEHAVGDIRSKLYGKDLFEGRFRVSRTAFNINVPIVNRQKNTLAFSLGVIHQFFYLTDVKAPEGSSNMPVANINTYIPMFSLGLTYIRRDTLFGKPVTFTGALAGIVDPPFERRQFTFTGLVSVPLIRTENTNLMGGVVVMIDPSSPAPAFLFLSYFHRFKSINTDLMVDVPSRIALRNRTSKRMSLTLFGELGGSNSFFKFATPTDNLPDNITYSSLEIKSGLMAEYRLTRKLVFSISGGMNATVKSRLLENNAKPKDYFISNKIGAVPYVQVGFSLLPFWKGLNL
jgi:hypothetical protein